MNLAQMREQLANLTAQYNAHVAQGVTLATAATPDVAAINAHNAVSNTLQAQIAALRNAIAAAEAQGAAAAAAQPAPAEDDSIVARRNAIRGSREYTRAFCAALRAGYKPGKSAYQERFKPLHDVMTIGGGDPAGSEGGFAVPVDVDTEINRLVSEQFAMRNFFRVVNVNTDTGSRNIGIGKLNKFVKIGEGLPAKKTGSGAYDAHLSAAEQKILDRVNYSVSTYRKMVELSREMMADEDAGLLAYVEELLADAKCATENAEFLALLNKLTPLTLDAGITGTVDKIKTVLNTKLRAAYSKRAMLMTNGEGFNVMDLETDSNGRALLQPCPSEATGNLVLGRRIEHADVEDLPDLETGHPLYIGDLQSYGVLFDRQGMEISTTDVGGDAWENNTISLRAIIRQDYQVWDPNAAKLLVLPKA